MKITLAILVTAGFMNLALAIEPKVITGRIGIDFQWDTSAMIVSNDTAIQPEMREITSSEESRFRMFVQSPEESAFFQTVVIRSANEEITTFVEL